MTDRQNNGMNTDDLLRKTFADDLPDDAAAGMRQRIDRFRAAKTRGQRSSPAWAWLFRRSVWAALSILMLVAGILLQGTRSSSPLADRISSIKTAYADFETIRR